jgi:hypothetical protein
MTWTPERRAAQAARCRAHRPWEKSTGPRTPEGKAASARNARKHGLCSARGKAIHHILRMQAQFVRALETRDASYSRTAALAAHFATLALPALLTEVEEANKRTEETRRKNLVKTGKARRKNQKSRKSD